MCGLNLCVHVCTCVEGGGKRERFIASQHYRSRTKNRMLYLTLGGKEFFANSQRYLERRIQLECDGELVKLPQRLQGVVFLNIPSYMAGTNFWGTEREKEVCTLLFNTAHVILSTFT